MNRSTTDPLRHRLETQALEGRYGLRVGAALSLQADALPHDVAERLRFAREKAMERARQTRRAVAGPPVATGGGTLALTGGEVGWGWRLASLVPAVGLVAGLVLIQMQHDDDRVRAAADMDAALLADDLPPAAYTDAGFVEFLRRSGSD